MFAGEEWFSATGIYSVGEVVQFYMQLDLESAETREKNVYFISRVVELVVIPPSLNHEVTIFEMIPLAYRFVSIGVSQ